MDPVRSVNIVFQRMIGGFLVGLILSAILTGFHLGVALWIDTAVLAVLFLFWFVLLHGAKLYAVELEQKEKKKEAFK